MLAKDRLRRLRFSLFASENKVLVHSMTRTLDCGRYFLSLLSSFLLAKASKKGQQTCLRMQNKDEIHPALKYWRKNFIKLQLSNLAIVFSKLLIIYHLNL